MAPAGKKLTVLLLILVRRRRRKQRLFWIHPLNLLRPQLGEHLKIDMMYNFYPDRFFQYTRMSPAQFDHLLNLVSPVIEKQDTSFRLAVSPAHRLQITLRYLVTGDSFATIATSFSIGRTTAGNIVRAVNLAIWDTLSPIYVKLPTGTELEKVVTDFYDCWDFPNCFGAIDGKHVMIQAPPNSGSTFYNYKGYYSIVLLAICDAQYRFTFVDVGAYGKQSDGGIFACSTLGKALEEGELELPEPRKLRHSERTQACTLIGDDAFSLSTYMMRPFPVKKVATQRARVFNYRLSRARRTIENTFGILGSRYRIYKRSIQADPEYVISTVKATIALHNYLRTDEMKMSQEKRQYCPVGYVDQDDEDNGDWRAAGPSNALQNLGKCKKTTYCTPAKEMRELLADYFMTEGSVPFQYNRATLLIQEKE